MKLEIYTVANLGDEPEDITDCEVKVLVGIGPFLETPPSNVFEIPKAGLVFTVYTTKRVQDMIRRDGYFSEPQSVVLEIFDWSRLDKCLKDIVAFANQSVDSEEWVDFENFLSFFGLWEHRAGP